MSTAELEKRVDRLEQELAELRALVKPQANPDRHAWRKTVGLFKDDPLFDEIVRLGREYRESQPYAEDVEA